MKRRADRRVRLGFQWSAGSWDGAADWFETLFRVLQGVRVHWNLPAVDPRVTGRRRAAVARQLQARIDASGDLVTSQGFAGACHPLLNLDELEKELAWGLKNPWGTGIADVFDLRPPVLIPAVADLRRPEAWNLYGSHGFSLVGVCTEASMAASPATALPVTRVQVPGVRRPELLQKTARALTSLPGDTFLLLDLTGETSAAHLEQAVTAALSGLGPAQGLSLVDIPAKELASPAPDWRVDWSQFPGPCLHEAIARASGLARKKRKKGEDVRDLLGLMSAQCPGTSSASPVVADAEARRRLVAHMAGDVTLSGASFDVRLAGGRFTGIVSRGSDALPRVAAVSRLRTGARELAYHTVSSFSFEEETGTGLREELALDGREDSSISLEYSFREDSPLLSIRGELRWPSLPSGAIIEQYAPLAFALRELAPGQSVELEAWAPDGSASRATLGEKDGPVVLPGARHRVRRADGGWVVLCYACPDGGSWGVPLFQVLRQRSRRMVMVNPFGSMTPFSADRLKNRRESFALLLGLEDP